MTSSASPSPSGYYGSLTPTEQSKLDEFESLARECLSDQKYVGPSSPRYLWTADDATNEFHYVSLRFLRARKFDVSAALSMFKSHVKWRQQWSVDSILLDSHKPKKFDLVQKLVPHFHHFYDKSGRPVFYEKLGKLDVSTLTALVSESEYLSIHIRKMELKVAEIETQNEKLKSANASPSSHSHLETFTLVLDLKGVTFSTNRAKSGYLEPCMKNDEANYPERLGKLILINVGWGFNIIWKIAQHIIDAKTKAKIVVIYGDPTGKLAEYVDTDVIPVEYGGKCTCGGADSKDRDQQKDTDKDKNKPNLCIPEYDVSTMNLNSLIVSSSSSEDDLIDEDLREITIPAGRVKVDKIAFDPTIASSVHWYFRCDNNADIRFRVHRYDFDDSLEIENDLEAKSEPDALKKISSALTPITVSDPENKKVFSSAGAYDVTANHEKKKGMFVITFDNSYSYFTSKKVKYSIMNIKAQTLVDTPSGRD